MNRVFELKNNLCELDRLKAEVNKLGKAINASEKVIYELNLALEEVISNIIFYGYEDNEEHQISIEFSHKNKTLFITISDDGRPFNPLETSEPNLGCPFEERDIGGLGIFLVRNVIDELYYKCENNSNILIMKKKL